MAPSRATAARSTRCCAPVACGSMARRPIRTRRSVRQTKSRCCRPCQAAASGEEEREDDAAAAGEAQAAGQTETRLERSRRTRAAEGEQSHPREQEVQAA